MLFVIFACFFWAFCEDRLTRKHLKMSKLCQGGSLFEVLPSRHLQHLHLFWEIRCGRLLTHVASALT